jgi:hypothetical protein
MSTVASGGVISTCQGHSQETHEPLSQPQQSLVAPLTTVVHESPTQSSTTT